MRSGSEAALERARDRWAAFVATQPGQEIDLSQQMFSVVDTIKSSTALTSALEGGSRDGDARANLARTLFQAA